MLKNVHGHIFCHQTIASEIYFGRHGLSRGAMKIIRYILAWIEKNGLPDDIEEIIEIAEKILPVFGLGDEWSRIKYLVRMYYMNVPDIIKMYEKKIMPEAGIDEMCILIPNFPDSNTQEAVDIICASVDKKTKFKVFAPLAYVNRPEVFGVKYYPALEGPPDWLNNEWKIVADLNKPVVCHSSPGGVRNKRFSEGLAKKYNRPGRWMSALEKYPLRVDLAHCGGREAFVKWFTADKFKPGINWSYDNMIRSYDGIEYPGKVYYDVAFHDDQTRSDYRKAVSNVDGYWNRRGMFGIDDPLTDTQNSVKTLAGWYRNVWGAESCEESNAVYKEFMYGN